MLLLFGANGAAAQLCVGNTTFALSGIQSGANIDLDKLAQRYALELRVSYHDLLAAVDLGVKTWPSDAWKIGGGTVWGWISYDADLDLVYYGTSNPGPWNAEQRPGDNKFTSGLFARDASTEIGRAHV